MCQSRYTVVDGYVIFTAADGARKIVSPQVVKKKGTKAEKEMVSGTQLRDLDVLDSPVSDAFPVASERLFRMLPVVERSFYADGSGHKVVKDKNTLINLKRRSYTLQVVELFTKSHRKKFLYLQREALTICCSKSDPFQLKAIRHERNNSVFYVELGIQHILFTAEDVHLLRVYQASKDRYVAESRTLMSYMGRIGRTRGLTRPLVHTFHHPVLGSAEIREFHTATVVRYGRDFAVLYYVLLNLNKLSFTGPLVSNFTDTEIDCTDEKELARRAAEIHRIFVDALTITEKRGLVHLLVRLCGLNLDMFAGETPVWDSVDRSRHRLDALKGWILNALIYKDPDRSCTYMESKTWLWVKEIYSKVCRELDYSAVYRIKYTDDDGLVVEGKRFSRDYVRTMYWELQSRVDELIAQLGQFYDMLPLETACCLVFDSRQEYLEESKVTPKHSFQALFSVEALSDLGPTPKDVIKAAVLDLIDSISYHLMTMVYLAACGPYRFPEIRILCASGPQKNVFVDDKSRRIQLLTTYTKNGSNKPLVKELDKTTSNYLFYFLTVIKTIQISLLEDYDQMTQDLFGESVEGVEARLYCDGLHDMSALELSQQVIRQFVFVDIASATLAHYREFVKLLLMYPTNVAPAQRLNFRELRHGFIGMLRRYVSQHGSRGPRSLSAAVIESMAGHSAQTGTNVYATDETDFSDVAQEQIKVSRVYADYLALGTSRVQPEVKAEKTRFKWRPSTSMLKLRRGIREIYGTSFRFRGEQQNICHDIYMSDSPVVAVQALTGFGKTALFQLPLMAIREEDAVSFVFVPYTVLQSDLQQRLAVGGLEVGLVKELLDGPPIGRFANVYVGTFNDLGRREFVELLRTWDFDTHLGMLVIDEFHNLSYETYRASAFRLIPRVPLDAFWKVVLLTATAGSTLERALGFLPVNTLEVSDWNLVKKPAVTHVTKRFFQVQDPIGVAFEYVQNLPEGAKAVLVFRTKEELSYAHESLEVVHETVHGDLSPQEKVKRIRRFIDNPMVPVLMGTKLVTEGIDVRGLRFVLLVNYLPPVIEYIQAAGRLRQGGECVALYTREAIKDDSINHRCPTRDICEFYGLPFMDHVRCCEEVGERPRDPVKRVAPPSTAEPPTKRPMPSELATQQRLLLDEFDGCRGVFQYLETPSAKTKELCYGIESEEGVEVPSDRCPNCMYQEHLCCCSTPSGKTLRQMTGEILGFLRGVLSTAEYSSYYTLYELDGPHQLLLKFVERKEQMKVAVNRLNGIVRFLGCEKLAPNADDRVDREPYNTMWEQLEAGKVDVVYFFATGRFVECAEMWSTKDMRGLILQRSEMYRPYFSANKLVKALGSNVTRHCYDVLKDRKTYRSEYVRNGPRALPRVVVPHPMYTLMLFGMFENTVLRRKLEREYQMPEVRVFGYWVRMAWAIMTYQYQSFRPLYIAMGAYAWHELRSEAA